MELVCERCSNFTKSIMVQCIAYHLIHPLAFNYWLTRRNTKSPWSDGRSTELYSLWSQRRGTFSQIHSRCWWLSPQVRIMSSFFFFNGLWQIFVLFFNQEELTMKFGSVNSNSTGEFDLSKKTMEMKISQSLEQNRKWNKSSSWNIETAILLDVNSFS